MNLQLVRTPTSDNLFLNALYSPGDTSKPAVLFIHGFCGDFYSNTFFHKIREQLQSQNIASLAIQTRGTGILTEFFTEDGEGREIGSYYEKLEEAHLDISAWIEFLHAQGYKDIILAGYSLGTIKAVRYLFEGKYADLVKKLVLLAPFDKNGYMERLIPGSLKDYVKIAEQMVQQGKGLAFVPPHMEDYPMSYQTYVSWYKDSDLSSMWDFYRGDEYNFPAMSKISVPTSIVVGDADDFFYIPELTTLEKTKEILHKYIKNLELTIIPGAEHSFVEFEERVAQSVVTFIVT